MNILDIVFWSFFGITVAFIAWQFLRLLYEALLEPRLVSRAKRRTSSGTVGIGAAGATDSVGATSDFDTSTSTESSSGGESSTSDMSGGGEYGGGGASGGW
jgi:uncharacterized membrane protein YgcG